jgi:outer membrane protein assembly factor BamB
MVHYKFVLAVFLVLCGFQNGQSQDWPEWYGPTRDGRVPDSDLIDRIPETGLTLLWEEEVELGYSQPVIADGRVIVTDYQKTAGDVTNNPGRRDRLEGKERILCFDADSGTVNWIYEYDRPYNISYPGGPRATPVISDGLVYCLGSEGDLVVLNCQTGKLIWKRQLVADYAGMTPIWGHAASPLIVGDQLFCLAGGPDSLVVSLNKKTGDENWKALAAEDIGYCPPSMIDVDGTPQLIIWDPETVYGLNPNDGSVYWQQPLKPGYAMSVLPPIQYKNLLFASGESDVSAMFELYAEPMTAKVLWEGKSKTSVALATSAAVFDDGYIYGADIKSGALICVQGVDGKRLWQTAVPTMNIDRPRGQAHGSAFLLKHKAMYFILSETGDFIAADLSPAGYEERGRFHVIDPTNQSMGRKVLWTYPAIADRKLFVRNDRVLKCYDLSR